MFLTSSWLVDILLILITVLYLLYKYFTRNFDHWKKQGVFYFSPIPFFGNFYDTFTFKTTLSEDLKSLYDKTDEPFFGVFIFDKPVLVIKSPELVKHILVKDFQYFKDRTLACPQHNKIFSNFIIFQKYSDWKKTRPIVSSAFTSTKLKGLFATITEMRKLLLDYIDKNEVVEGKTLSKIISTELVSRYFFGVNGNCFTDKNAAFLQMSKRIFECTLRNGIIHGLFYFKSDWVDWFRLEFIRKSDQDYLTDTFKDSVEKREITASNGNVHITKDYIDSMLEIKLSDDKSSDECESNFFLAMANTIQFYLAGEETTRSLITFTMYEMTIYPHVQEKAREEILSVLKKYGKLTFESLQEMEYLGMCLNETSRKYVTLLVIDRKATKDYKVPGTDFTIKKGTNIYIPYYALHMDEKYFSEPQKYKPERFLDENVNSDGLNYLPFGAGPRVCIGKRFAQVTAKMVLVTILSMYKLQPCEDTPSSIKFNPKSFSFQATGEIPIKFTPLEESQKFYEEL